MDKDIKGRRNSGGAEPIDPDGATEIVADQLARILLTRLDWKKQSKKGRSKRGKSPRLDYWFF